MNDEQLRAAVLPRTDAPGASVSATLPAASVDAVAPAEGTHKAPLQPEMPPTVYFIGVGPGDPGLLTHRGSDILRRCGIVVADDHEHAEILHAFQHSQVPQLNPSDLGSTPEERGEHLATLAVDNGIVARLVNNDGVLFHDTAREAAGVNAAGAAFEIIPGVGLVSSVSAYTGVSLTPDEHAVIHLSRAGSHVSDDPAMGHISCETEVFGGTVADTQNRCQVRLAHGWDADTPMIISSDISTVHQFTLETTLGAVAKRLGEDFEPETWVYSILGSSLQPRGSLAWFENKPLFGWKILIPRSKEQGTPTAEALSEFGAEGVVVPTVSIHPPRTPHQMEKAIRSLVTGDYQWIGFTSVNAVRAIRMWLGDLGLDSRCLAGVKVAAVGEATAKALADWGITPDLIPTGEWSARGLVADWPDFDAEANPINKVLLPRADIATDVLVNGLSEKGWEVDDITAYRTVRAAPPPAPIRESIKRGDFDAVLFTSSSTVRNLVGIAGKPFHTTVIACIGPMTAETAKEHGLRVDVVAEKATMGSLISGVIDWAKTHRQADIEAGQSPLRPSQRRRTRGKKKVS